jgi:hypothetical protein
MDERGAAQAETGVMSPQPPERLQSTPRSLPAAPVALLGYEFRIIRLSVVGTALALLGFISLILILGPPHKRGMAIGFFEVLTSLTLLATTSHLLAVDQDHRALEFVLLSTTRPFWLYLRRFLLVLVINIGVIVALAFIWHLCYLPLPVPDLLLVALPPTILVTSLSFGMSLACNNANIGAMLTGAYWILHQLLRKYGDRGWFGYLFLFKATYYPASATFLANRLVLLLLAGCLLAASSVAFRRIERYL